MEFLINLITVNKKLNRQYNGLAKCGNRVGPLCIVAIISIFTAAGMSSCNSKKRTNSQMQQQMGPPSVSVYTTSPARYDVSETFPASLEANTRVELRPDVSGYLEAVRVADGSHVHRGQVLYEIDKSRYQAAYNQAKAALQQSEADLSQKKRDMERYQELLKHDAVARQVVDQAETALKTAEANVAASKASLNRAATDLNHAVIRSPMNGKLGISQVKVGDIINAGQTVLNTIVNDNPMYVDINIPQARIRDFTGKQLAAKSFNLLLSDSSRYPSQGKLVVINNSVNPASGTIQVRLQFPNNDGLLKSGMNGTVLILEPTGNSTIAIPTHALIHTLSENSVYVVDQNSVIQSKRVDPGPIVDTMTIIRNGLGAGDRVVTSGLQRVHPGDTVNVVSER